MTFERIVPILYSADVTGSQGGPGTWVAINVANVDEYYETIKVRDAKILSPPGDKEWFMREMLLEDPDGHIIRFEHGIE